MYLNPRMSKAQSLIEYAVLLSVVISALILMQAIVKRGFSGNLNEAATRMGEQYSISNTTTQEDRTMDNPKDLIIDEIGTLTGNASKIKTYLSTVPDGIEAKNYDPLGTVDKDVYSYSGRIGQKYSTTTKNQTDSAIKEKSTLAEYNAADQAIEYGNFEEPFDEGGGPWGIDPAGIPPLD